MLYCLLVVQLAFAGPRENLPVRPAHGDSLTVLLPTGPAQVQPILLDYDEPPVPGDPTANSAESEYAPLRAQYASLRPISEIIAELTGTIAPGAGRSTGIPLRRGTSIKRIGVEYDGVPLTHSSQRDGPSLMALAMLDPATVNGVTYRSGLGDGDNPAIQAGGVLELSSRLDDHVQSPLLAAPLVVRMSQQFSSADRGWSARLNAEGSRGRLRYRFGGLGRILGNLRAGEAPGEDSVQPYTGLRETAAHALASFSISPALNLRGGLLMGWRGRNAIMGDLEAVRLSTPPPTLDLVSPRQMTLAYLSARWTGAGTWRSASATVWFNRQREDAAVRRPAWDKTIFDDDRVSVVGVRGRANLAIGSSHLLGMSLQGTYEGVDARRKEVREELVTFYQRGRFPGGTFGQTLDALVEDRWEATDGTTFRGGLRWTAHRRYSNYGPSVFGTSGEIGIIDRTYSGLSWFAGVDYEVGAGHVLSASVANTYTAPGLDDLASNAYWFGGRDVPSPGVDGERAIKYEFSYGLTGTEGSRLRISAYRAAYLNLIRRTWFDDGPDELAGTNDDLFRFINQHGSIVTGLELHGDYPVAAIGDSKILATVAGFVQHVSAHPDVPHLTPPAVFRAGIRVEKGASFAESFVRGALSTPATRISHGNVVSLRTPGWITAGIRGGFDIGPRAGLNVAVENIADVRYREHGSVIEAPGRNLIVALTYSL